MRILVIAAAFGAALLAAGSANAIPVGPGGGGCVLTADPVPLAQSDVDPFGAAPTLIDFNVVLHNTGSGACSGDLYLTPAGGQLRLIGGASDLTYEFTVPSGLGSAGELGPVHVDVPATSQRTAAFRVSIDPGQVVPPGLYSTQLTLRLTEAAANVPLTSPTVNVKANVLSRVQMSISGTASPGRGSIGLAAPSIDFGTLETGESQKVFVNVWANTSVSVTLTSLNGGVMKHTTTPSVTPISYLVNLDGVSASLASDLEVTRTPPLSFAGASYPLMVTVGDVTGHFGGAYQDTITVRVDEN